MTVYFALWFGGAAPDNETPSPRLLVQDGVKQYTTCNSFGTSWSTALLSIEGAVLILGVYLVVKNCKVPLLFRESGVIAVVVYNTAVVSAVTVALVSTVLSEPPNSTPLVGASILLVAYVIFFVMIAGQILNVAVLAGYFKDRINPRAAAAAAAGEG